MKAPQVIVSIDGRIVTPATARIPALDRGLLLGYGLFETILAFEKTPLRLNDHLARFGQSQRALAIKSPFTRAETAAIIKRATAAHPAPVKRLRVTLTAGERGFWSSGATKPGSLIVIVLPHHLTADLQRRSARLIDTATVDHWLAAHKTTSRLPYVLPAPDAPDYDSREMSLLFSQSFGVSEFTIAGVLARFGDDVITPPSGHALPSVTGKAALAALARQSHWRVRQRRLNPEELFTADELLGVSSLSPVFSVAELTGRPEGRVKRKSFPATELAEYLRPRLLNPPLRKYLKALS